ncbi:hypothetical protein C8F01DRAFT_1123021 [Mycena amicta]|nr:hypothetical protein C8F01DRAFT_1123021 [Mycena amicta]
MAPSSDIIVIDSDSDVEVVTEEGSKSKPIPVYEEISRTGSLKKVKEQLRKILKGALRFDGEIACFTQFHPNDVPNPFLSIEGVGVVGVPLSARDSAVILLSLGVQEVPASQITFENPGWDAWVKETAGKKAFKDLVGDHAPPMTPSFALRKLVLKGPGSETTNFSVPTTENQMGTIIIFLPSVHTGGRLGFNHEDQNFEVDELEDQSGFFTSVVASFSGVDCEMSPILSGYQIGLVYDILSRPGAEPIALPNTQQLDQHLKSALSTWATDSESSDARIHLLLAQKYKNDQSFKCDALTGADDNFWKHLAPIVRDLGLHPYFAHIEVKVEASSSVTSWEYYYEGRNPFMDIGEDDFHFNIEDQLGDGQGELSVTQTVGMDGMPLCVPNPTFELGDLVDEDIDRYGEDDSEFVRDDEWHGSLTHIYRRTVLVLCKSSDGFALDMHKLYDHATTTLRNSDSAIPSEKEMALVNGLLQFAGETNKDRRHSIACLLQSCATRWKNLPILLRMSDACGVDKDVYVLGIDNLVAMYQAFGWGPLKELFDKILENEQTNPGRQAVLTALLSAAKAENNTELCEWCTNAQERLLRSLRHLEVDQIRWLLEQVAARGEDFLRDVIIPQLKTQVLELPFWMALAEAVQSMSQTLSRVVIALCVEQASTIFPAFPLTKSSEPDTTPIMAVLRLCIETKHYEQLKRITERMRDAAVSGNLPQGVFPWVFYSRLVTSLDTYLLNQVQPEEMTPLFSDAIRFMLQATSGEYLGQVTSTFIEVLLKAFRRAGGVSAVKTSLEAGYWATRSAKDKQALLRAIQKEFPDGDLSPVLSSLVDETIRSFDMSTFLPRQPATSQSYTILISEIVQLVQFCIDIGDQGKVPGLLLMLLAAPRSLTLGQHVDKVLAPLILHPALKTLLAPGGDFESFCVAVIKCYATTVVDLHPHELVPATELEGVGCSDAGCEDCQTLRMFFQQPHTQIDFARVHKQRSHLEQHIKSTGVWGVGRRTLTAEPGQPHILRIKKPLEMTTNDKKARNRRGMTLLAELGDEPRRSRILGADYIPISTKFLSPASTLKRHGTHLETSQAKKKSRT